MSIQVNRRLMIALGLAALAAPGQTAPRAYGLGPNGAAITYIFDLQGTKVRGTAPVHAADLQIDPDNLIASRAQVSADMRRARTGLIFATQAMKSASVLDAARFPFATFRSTQVKLAPGGHLSGGAMLIGDLTVRDVTQSVRFAADLFRKPGSPSNDLSALDIHLRGAIDRRAFGVLGYADLVHPMVGLDIRADIVAI